MATCLKISPFSTIGTMVLNTTSGGGIRNGLNTTVDRNCHTTNATRIEPAKSPVALTPVIPLLF
jgi:hypothetical protein